MARRSDDDDAMVLQCDGALLLLRWYDVDEAMLYRAKVIASSHHRYRVIASLCYHFFLHIRCFYENGVRCEYSLSALS